MDALIGSPRCPRFRLRPQRSGRGALPARRAVRAEGGGSDGFAKPESVGGKVRDHLLQRPRVSRVNLGRVGYPSGDDPSPRLVELAVGARLEHEQQLGASGAASAHAGVGGDALVLRCLVWVLAQDVDHLVVPALGKMLVQREHQGVLRGEVVEQPTFGESGGGGHRFVRDGRDAVGFDNVEGGLEDGVSFAGPHERSFRGQCSECSCDCVPGRYRRSSTPVMTAAAARTPATTSITTRYAESKAVEAA